MAEAILEVQLRLGLSDAQVIEILKEMVANYLLYKRVCLLGYA